MEIKVLFNLNFREYLRKWGEYLASLVEVGNKLK